MVSFQMNFFRCCIDNYFIHFIPFPALAALTWPTTTRVLDKRKVPSLCSCASLVPAATSGDFFSTFFFFPVKILWFSKCSISIFLWRNSEILQSTLRFNYRHVRVVGKVSEVFGITLTCSVTVAFSTEHVPKERNFENQNSEIGNDDDHFFFDIALPWSTSDIFLCDRFKAPSDTEVNPDWIRSWLIRIQPLKIPFVKLIQKTTALPFEPSSRMIFFWGHDGYKTAVRTAQSISVRRDALVGIMGQLSIFKKLWSRSSWKVQY